MNYKMIGRIVSLSLLIEAFFMLPPLFISVGDGDRSAALAFLETAAIILAAAGLLLLLTRGASRGFYARDGLVCVAAVWLALSALGCLPFVISGEIPRYIDALFEMVSGFTTTGASIVPKVEELSRGILFWRSFSHWLGGMGVLVLLLALVPISGRSDGFAMHILRAESPGPNVGKLVPRMKQTAAILYLMYVGLTVLDILFLLLGGMPLFEALCTAFGTAGTGGFGVKNDSMTGYSPYLQNVCSVFMLLFGMNFSCYYLLMLRRFRGVLRDEELHLYLGIALGATALIALDVRSYYATFGETVRHAFFQVSSIMTTTGFATTDFDLWPSFSKCVLLSLMVVGACAGSTGGGLKCARVVLLAKSLRRSISQALHPQRTEVVHVNGEAVSEQVLSNTNAYLSAYFIIVVASFLVISLDGFSIATNLSAVLACFNNIGPGLDIVGPTSCYASFSTVSKLALIFDMLAGRLEIFPILVIFCRSTWTRK